MNPAGPPDPPAGVESVAAVALRTRAGLCKQCRHAEVLRSKRSAFLRCARADEDARYPRYPGLPVLACHGFEAVVAGEIEQDPGG